MVALMKVLKLQAIAVMLGAQRHQSNVPGSIPTFETTETPPPPPPPTP